jgi:hypothetical protein
MFNWEISKKKIDILKYFLEHMLPSSKVVFQGKNRYRCSMFLLGCCWSTLHEKSGFFLAENRCLVFWSPVTGILTLVHIWNPCPKWVTSYVYIILFHFLKSSLRFIWFVNERFRTELQLDIYTFFGDTFLGATDMHRFARGLSSMYVSACLLFNPKIRHASFASFAQ